MPFGEIISTLRADLGPLEADLKRAEERIRQYLSRVNQLNARVGGSGVSAPGGGSLRNISPERQMAQQLDLERKSLQVAEARARIEQQLARLRETNLRIQQRQAAAVQRSLAGRDPMGFSHLGAQGDVSAQVRAAEQAERRIRGVNESAERDLRRLMASRASAYKEDEVRRIAAAKAAAAEEKRQLESLQAFYRSRLDRPGAAGIHPLAQPGQTYVDRGIGSRSALLPEHIERARAASERFMGVLDRIGQHSLRTLQDQVGGIVQGLKTAAGIGALSLVGAFAALIKNGVQLNAIYERNQSVIASVLGLTTELVDKQDKVASSAVQMRENYALSQRFIVKVREEAVKTLLTTEQLMANVTTNLGFATAGSPRIAANPLLAVPLIGKISTLAKALGAENEREQGFEIRALLTGRQLPRSRIGRVLQISKEDIENAKQAGNLLEFLNQRLKAGDPYIERARHNWFQLLTTLESKFKELLRVGTEKAFQRIQAALDKLNTAFTETKIREWGQQFAEYVGKAIETVQQIANSEGFKMLMNLLRFIVEHADTILKVFVGFKALQTVSAIRAFGQGLSRPGGALAGSMPTLGPALNAAGLVGAAAGTGLGIGALINREFIGRQEDRARAIDAETARMRAAHPEAAMMEDARRRVAIRRAELQRAQGVIAGRAVGRMGGLLPTPETIAHFTQPDERREITLRKQMLKEAEDAERQTEERISLLHVQHQLRRFQMDRQSALRRRAQKHEEEEQDRKDLLEAEKKIDELLHHKEHAIRVEGELDKLQVRENIKDKTLQAKLIQAIDQGTFEKIHELRNTEKADVRKQLAEMSGNKRAQVEADYISTVNGIQKEHHARQDEARLIAMARVKGLRELRDTLDAQALAEKQFAAQATGDEIAQITLRNTEELHSRIKQIEQEKSGVEQRVAIQRAYQLEVLKNEREVHDKVREMQERATSLQRQAFDLQSNFHKTRVNAEKEFQQLQQRTARELRDLVRERRDAQRELARAQEDLPGQMENLTLSRRQRDIRRQIESRFLATANPYGGGASLEQRATIRQLAGQIAGGDVFSSEQAIQQAGRLGFLNQYNAGDVRALSRQAAGIGMRKEDLADTEADTQEKRQAEDAERNIEDLKQRAKDLDERQAEILQSYKDSVAAMRENLNKSVIDTSDSMKKLNVEVQKLVETMRASHLPVPAALAGLAAQAKNTELPVPKLRRLPDGSFTNLPDTSYTTQPRTPSFNEQAKPTINFIFGEGAIQSLTPKGEQAAQDLADELIKLSRRTRPTSR